MTLFHSFNEVANSRQPKVALISQGGIFSYGDLLRQHAALERHLRRQIGSERRRIAFFSQHQHLYVAMMLMASRYGHRLYLVRPEKLAKYGVKFDFFVTDAQVSAPSDLRVVRIKPDWFTNVASEKRLPKRKPGKSAVFVFNTSGSTGMSKLVPLTERRFLNYVSRHGNHGVYGPPGTSERLYCSASPEVAWAEIECFRVLLRGGSVFSLIDRQQFLASFIDQYRIEALAIAPALATQLAALPSVASQLSSVRYITMGGAYVAPKLLTALEDVTNAKITVFYGATEEFDVSQYDSREIDGRDAGYLGEISGDDLALAFFSDAGEILPDANEGVLGVRRPAETGISGYENISETENQEYFVDGYFITGDIVRREGNSLYLVGRTKNIINQSGNKFSLEQIEETALTELSVTDLCAIVCTPSSLEEEELHLFYISNDTLERAKVEQRLRKSFRGLVLSGVHKVQQFPVGESGKIQRAVLQASLAKNGAAGEI